MRRLPILCLVAGLTAGTASAEAAPTCSILAQMSVSSWLQMLGTLTDGTTQTNDLSKFYYLSGSFANLGCDVPALQQSLDCMLERAGSGPSRDLALSCLTEAGLTAGE